MKKMLSILLAFSLLACNRAKQARYLTPPPYFISGIYTAYERANFNEAWDTLIISIDSVDHRLYRITRCTYLQPTVGSASLDPQSLISRWTGTFDPVSNLLTALAGGQNLLFIPSGNYLQSGGITYNRIQ